jgi:Tfp pilus assembly protein PilX
MIERMFDEVNLVERIARSEREKSAAAAEQAVAAAELDRARPAREAEAGCAGSQTGSRGGQ